MNDEVADVFENEEAEVAGDDFVRVAVADDDAIEVLQGALLAGTRETPAYAKTVFGRYRRGWEGSDMKEDDDGGGSLEFLQEVDEDRRGTVRTACFIEVDADASKSADW